MPNMDSSIQTDREIAKFAEENEVGYAQSVAFKTEASPRGISHLVGALAKAQLQFKPVLKDTTNPHYGNRYADLASVIAATQEALANNGLVVIQLTKVDIPSQRAGVRTILAHSSGQTIENELLLPATMQSRLDAQSIGSALTYARRYSLQAILGVSAEEDDNAEAAIKSSHQIRPSVATNKLKEAANRDEEVVLTPYKKGLVALSGKGLPIVRAELTNQVLADLGWAWEGNVAVIPVISIDAFREICRTHNVGTIFMDAPKPNEEPSDGPVKANIPTFHSPSGQTKSTDPVILCAERIRPKNPGGKEFLSVNWDGKKVSCWDKRLWPHLEQHVNRPAMLVIDTRGQYNNIVGIQRLDGNNFQDEQNQV